MTPGMIVRPKSRFYFETEFHWVAMADLEVVMQTRLASKSHHVYVCGGGPFDLPYRLKTTGDHKYVECS